MNPYRSVRIVVEPAPRWWRATTTKFWVHAFAAAYHALLCVFVLAACLDPSAWVTLPVSVILVAMNAFECRAEWVEAVRPRLAPRTRVVPGPPPCP